MTEHVNGVHILLIWSHYHRNITFDRPSLWCFRFWPQCIPLSPSRANHSDHPVQIFLSVSRHISCTCVRIFIYIYLVFLLGNVSKGQGERSGYVGCRLSVFVEIWRHSSGGPISCFGHSHACQGEWRTTETAKPTAQARCGIMFKTQLLDIGENNRQAMPLTWDFCTCKRTVFLKHILKGAEDFLSLWRLLSLGKQYEWRSPRMKDDDEMCQVCDDYNRKEVNVLRTKEKQSRKWSKVEIFVAAAVRCIRSKTKQIWICCRQPDKILRQLGNLAGMPFQMATWEFAGRWAWRTIRSQ